MNAFWDRLGISTSIFCIAHCLLTPILLMTVPFLGAALSSEWFHVLVVTVALPVAVFSLWSGYRVHRHTRGLWLGGIALVIMLATLSFEGDHHHVLEVVMMVLAGLLLASAHYFNLRECRSAQR